MINFIVKNQTYDLAVSGELPFHWDLPMKMDFLWFVAAYGPVITKLTGWMVHLSPFPSKEHH